MMTPLSLAWQLSGQAPFLLPGQKTRPESWAVATVKAEKEAPSRKHPRLRVIGGENYYVCNICEQTLPMSKFSPPRGNRFDARCKECRSKRKKKERSEDIHNTGAQGQSTSLK